MSHDSFKFAIRSVDETGRMLGGWLKQQDQALGSKHEQHDKTLWRILSGRADANLSFDDLRGLFFFLGLRKAAMNLNTHFQNKRSQHVHYHA
ncbi:MAG: hypothetical protein H7839_13590 [Magnetococcus sp. YQC-5]